MRKAAVAKTLELNYGLKVTDATRENFARRINLFLADNERGKRIVVRIGEHRFPLPASRSNGHLEGTVQLAVDQVEKLAADDQLSYSAVLAEGDRRQFTGTVHLVRPQGLSVISDIDDTIKITEVAKTRKTLENTFFRDFQAAPGMSQIYGKWAEQGVKFNFVSSSPWQLYEPLDEFSRRAGFPSAPFSLKYVRLKDRTLLNLLKKGTETKPRQIEPILESYRGRRFILIGDSGEQDPEVYADMARKHPEQIVRIYIRNVTKASPQDERFKKVFDGVSSAKWELFTDPSSLELPGPSSR